MIDTMPALDSQPTVIDDAPAVPRSAESPIRCGTASLRGSAHPRNEDRSRFEAVDRGATLVAVADGLGSNERSDLAAERSLHGLFRAMRRYLRRDRGKDADRHPKLLWAAAGRANLDLWLLRKNLGQKLGSTLCAALVGDDGRTWVVNAGDTRCYHLRGTRYRQITRDHSLVREMVHEGLLDEGEALHHPWRNRITRSLGREAELDLDLFAVTLQPGDALVLVSDGVWEPLGSSSMMRTVHRHRDPARAARSLVEQAREADGRDDMTCAALYYR